jgi:hypothetical protein
MKKPQVWCPACKEVYHKSTRDEYVVICDIIYQQYEQGKSNFPNYTVEPSHCEGEGYHKCHVWRGSKDADWAKEAGNYQSLEEFEKLRL